MHIVSPLFVRNSLRSFSFEKKYYISFIFYTGYIIIKYRSSSILGKIHLLFGELWSIFNLTLIWNQMNFEIDSSRHEPLP